jgi:hypothetical protein
METVMERGKGEGFVVEWNGQGSGGGGGKEGKGFVGCQCQCRHEQSPPNGNRREEKIAEGFKKTSAGRVIELEEEEERKWQK